MDKFEELKWELQGSEYYDAELILFDKRIDKRKNPRTQKVLDRLVLESVDWVNIVALDPKNRSLMVRQFRFGVGYVTLETPGGMVDPGEQSLDSAKRELLEETGFASDEWSYLGAVEPNPAFHNHLCHHWLASDVAPASAQNLGAGEAIDVEFMSADDIRRAIASGELRHALALSALARVFSLWSLPNLQGASDASQ